MQRNIYTGFEPINWNKSDIFRRNFFNDFEFVLISNYLTKQEDQVLFITNLEIKMSYKNSKLKTFKIPYRIIEAKTGLDKNKVQKILKSLQKKKILIIHKPNFWTWNLPGIRGKLTYESEVSVSAVSQPKLIFIQNPINDPMFEGLDLDQKF